MIVKKYRWVNGLIMLSSFILIFGVVSKIIMHTQMSIHEKVSNTISVTETFEIIWKEQGSRKATSYAIRTYESSAKYLIGSVTKQSFDYALFYNIMEPGMPITLIISNDKTLTGSIPVYAVSSGELSFLTVEDTIKVHLLTDKHNEILTWSCIITGFILLVVSLLIRARLFN